MPKMASATSSTARDHGKVAADATVNATSAATK